MFIIYNIKKHTYIKVFFTNFEAAKKTLVHLKLDDDYQIYKITKMDLEVIEEELKCQY